MHSMMAKSWHVSCDLMLEKAMTACTSHTETEEILKQSDLKMHTFLLQWNRCIIIIIIVIIILIIILIILAIFLCFLYMSTKWMSALRNYIFGSLLSSLLYLRHGTEIFGINKDCRSLLYSVTSALQIRALCSYIPHIYSKWFFVCFILKSYKKFWWHKKILHSITKTYTG